MIQARAAVGLIAIGLLGAGLGAGLLWPRNGGRVAAEVPAGDPVAAQPTPVAIASEVPDEDLAPTVEPARPGSLQAALLAMTPQARRNLIGRTLTERGMECPAIGSAEPIDAGGSHWRANCGGGLIFWIAIDQSGRLAVEPAPYGDIEPPFIRFERLEGEGRTLELQRE
jgi:hypothetical protein